MWNTWDRIFLGFAFQQVINAIENGPREPTPPWLIEQERKRKEQAAKRRVERRRALKQLAMISGAVVAIYTTAHLLNGAPARPATLLASPALPVVPAIVSPHAPLPSRAQGVVPAPVIGPETACRMLPDLLGVCPRNRY